MLPPIGLPQWPIAVVVPPAVAAPKAMDGRATPLSALAGTATVADVAAAAGDQARLVVPPLQY